MQHVRELWENNSKRHIPSFLVLENSSVLHTPSGEFEWYLLTISHGLVNLLCIWYLVSGRHVDVCFQVEVLGKIYAGN